MRNTNYRTLIQNNTELFEILKELVPDSNTFPSRCDYYDVVPNLVTDKSQIELVREAFIYLTEIFLNSKYNVKCYNQKIKKYERDEDMIVSSLSLSEMYKELNLTNNELLNIEAELRNLLYVFKERFKHIITYNSEIVIGDTYGEYLDKFGTPTSSFKIDGCIYFIHSYGGMKYSWLEIAQLILEFYIANISGSVCNSIAVYKSNYMSIEKYYPQYISNSNLINFIRRKEWKIY